ncbi:hypothetical protein TWF506_007467 [Arthrobotrys conoides]|uniref:Uncharacterized protein n=1 Tax=Arthrobotrys conoides TaxID=74498 RepID=A0AAN8N7B4_9PEZI
MGKLTNKKIEENGNNYERIEYKEKYRTVSKWGRAQNLEAMADAGQKGCRGRAGMPLAEKRRGDAMVERGRVVRRGYRRQGRRPGAPAR